MKTFPVRCPACGTARGILPTGVLICPRCDVEYCGFPNQHLVKDVRQ